MAREPPAYLERVVPADVVLKIRVDDETGLRRLASALYTALLAGRTGPLWVEARPRGFHVERGRGFDSKRLSSGLMELLGELGLRISRSGAAEWLIVEDTRFGIVAALLPPRGDRVLAWRERRLKQIY